LRNQHFDAEHAGHARHAVAVIGRWVIVALNPVLITVFVWRLAIVVAVQSFGRLVGIFRQFWRIGRPVG
jgi:hypothetical protein